MQEQINDMQKSINRIEDALLGNEFGNKGIVKRLECTEKKTVENKKELTNIKSNSVLMGSVAGGGVWGIIEAVKAWFHHG